MTVCARPAVANGSAPAIRAAVLATLLLGTLPACGAGDGGGNTGSEAGTAQPDAEPSGADLPPAEDVASLGALSIPATPFPDFAWAHEGIVWVTGVDPGIVGYDAGTGDLRLQVETADVYLAMDGGFGSLWAAEASDGRYPDTLVRIDPATGAVTSRTAAPEPGVKPESSLAVTDEAVWAVIGQYEDPEDRSLAAFDPQTGAVRDVFPAPRAANAARGGFGSLWVSTSDGTVVRIAPADGSTEATIETGGGSGFMTVTEDAVWVLNGTDGTVSRIDPGTDEVEATIRVSEGPVSGGDIAAGGGSVWVRTTQELATEVDAETNEVLRVLGPPAGSGSVAVTDAAVWLTAHDVRVIHRVPTG